MDPVVNISGHSRDFPNLGKTAKIASGLLNFDIPVINFKIPIETLPNSATFLKAASVHSILIGLKDFNYFTTKNPLDWAEDLTTDYLTFSKIFLLQTKLVISLF